VTSREQWGKEYHVTEPVLQTDYCKLLGV